MAGCPLQAEQNLYELEANATDVDPQRTRGTLGYACDVRSRGDTVICPKEKLRHSLCGEHAYPTYGLTVHFIMRIADQA